MIKNEAIIKAFNFRHACKVFDAEKKISEADFETILETGRLSPSSFGFEPWKFLVVQNQELREKLKPFTWGAQGTLPTASHFIVILSRKQNTLKYDSEYISHMMYDVHHIPEEMAEKRRSFYEKFQKSDFKLLESQRATFDWANKQCYIALGNMMSSAAMLGIDSCPIEGFVAEDIEKVISSDFGIESEEYGVAVMVAFGYRVNAQPVKTRQTLEDVVSWYR
jgi:hypothetical protein